MAFLLPGNGALDLTANWYEDLFQANAIRGVFRRGPESFDVQAGYSQELYAGGPDLRIHATGYRFRAPGGAYGWSAGAELKSRDGMFSVKYEAGQDRLYDGYHTIAAFVNLGLDLGALTEGRSPFTMPEPIFRSPRNLSHLLSRPVKRDYITRALNRTQGAAVPGCASELPGSVLATEEIVRFVLYTTNPPIPPLGGSFGTSRPVTICWCGALADYSNVQFRTYDDTTGWRQFLTTTITQGDGCVNATIRNDSLALGNGVEQLITATTLQFSQGGGVSFQFP